METIAGILISSAVTLLVCIINNHYQANATRTLLEYKLEQLTNRVDKHNSVIERTYRLEQEVALHDEKLDVANHRIADLERGAD
mgnify:CR=1 FL=1